MVEHIIEPPTAEEEEEVTFYYNPELIEKNEGGDDFINEFKKLKKMGEGAFSKVYRVERKDINEETGEEVDYFAMKMLNKDILRK